MLASDIVVMASGTTSLEAMLLKNPWLLPIKFLRSPTPFLSV